MLKNRSLPPGSIFPELVYPDLGEAVKWLSRVYGFKERLRIGDHRCQLMFGDASVIVIGGGGAPSQQTEVNHSVMLRVEDVDQHCEQSRRNGAKIVREPETYPFGERQYTAEDPGRHRWTFTQTVADVPPVEWGAKVASGVQLRSSAQVVMLDHLAIPVAQVDRSRDWYLRHLNLELEFEIPQHKTVALKDDGNLTLFLYERPNTQGSTSCTLTFQVFDVEAKYRELSANGVIFEKSPQKLAWGYGAELRDPDGYMIYLWDEKSMREKGRGSEG